MPSLAVFVPHPDDEGYAFGGLMALAARAGWDVEVHCATSGEGGRPLENEDRPALGLRREAELTESCRILGARPPVFWRLPDGRLWGRSPERHRLRSALSSPPDVALTLGADGVYGHADHLALHAWVRDAWGMMPADRRPALLFAAFPPGLFRSQYEKCLPGNTLRPPRRLPGRLKRWFRRAPLIAPGQLGSDVAHYEVEIAVVRGQKLAAIAAHRSQLTADDPFSMFPAGTVDRLLEVERFVDASGGPVPSTAALMAGLAATASAG